MTGVPAGTGYQLAVMKDGFLGLWGAVDVVKKQVSDAGVKNYTSAEIADPSCAIVWKGALAGPPADPEKNWTYYDTGDRVSYIYDGNGAQAGTQPAAASYEPGEKKAGNIHCRDHRTFDTLWDTLPGDRRRIRTGRHSVRGSGRARLRRPGTKTDIPIAGRLKKAFARVYDTGHIRLFPQTDDHAPE